MIKQVELSEPSEYFNPYRNGDERLINLWPLSQINFFVGANNSGKSRLLRGLAKEFSFYENTIERTAEFKNEGFLIALTAVQRNILVDKSRRELQTIADGLDEKDIKKFIRNQIPNKVFLNEHDFDKILARLKKQIFDSKHPFGNYDLDTELGKAKEDATEKALTSLRKYFLSLMPTPKGKRFKVTYIPVLRSLRGFYEAGNNSDFQTWKSLLYANLKRIGTPTMQLRTLLDYFTTETEQTSPDGKSEFDITFNPSSIFTGEHLYDLFRDYKTSKQPKRAFVNAFEEFLSRSFFSGQKVEINSIEDERGKELHIKIGEEDEFPVYALGDGIQAIILLCFPVFFYQDEPDHLVFIEEPELFLHPGMQRIFTDMMRSFPKVQFFIATHSNHLLEASLDYPAEVSVFSVDKKLMEDGATFQVESLAAPGSSVLNLLGVRNSSVFLANCTLWVEGISDRLYLRKYLELYMGRKEHRQPEFKEDLHHAFLEFGGNNVLHYDFADVKEYKEAITANKLSNRIFLIHDADNGKEARHELLYHQLGKNYEKLPVREIENLLTPGILRKTLSDFQVPNQKKLEFKDIDQQTFDTEPLAVVVENMISAGEIKKIFSSPKGKAQGRLYDKAEFARAAVAHLKGYDDLSEGAKRLTEAVYQFILANN